MTGIFAEATAVTRTALSEGSGRFDAEVKPGWDIGGNANGGYLMAIAGRAMAETVGRPPLSVTAHYLRPGPAGPCVVETTTVRSGRRLATATANLSIDGSEIVRMLGTFGDQVVGGPELTNETPVDLPAYDDCELPPDSTDSVRPAMMDRLAVRIRPGDEGFRVGRPSGAAEIRGWFTFADHQLIDAIGLLLVADAFPPPIFNTKLPVAWVPTVELTVHIRGVPEPGPLRCAFRSRFIRDGLIDEEGEIWDSTGALVAQSRQLSLFPRDQA